MAICVQRFVFFIAAAAAVVLFLLAAVVTAVAVMVVVSALKFARETPRPTKPTASCIASISS